MIKLLIETSLFMNFCLHHENSDLIKELSKSQGIPELGFITHKMTKITGSYRVRKDQIKRPWLDRLFEEYQVMRIKANLDKRLYNVNRRSEVLQNIVGFRTNFMNNIVVKIVLEIYSKTERKRILNNLL